MIYEMLEYFIKIDVMHQSVLPKSVCIVLELPLCILGPKLIICLKVLPVQLGLDLNLTLYCMVLFHSNIAKNSQDLMNRHI